jgi:hypothetical protein
MVHFVVFIGKDPEVSDLFRQVPRVLLAVVGTDAQKDQEALPDPSDLFPSNSDCRFQNPLHHGSHGVTFPSGKRMFTV